MSTETCTVESGLLRKKPCGQPAVTKCANCEQPLCSKHSVPRMSAGKKTFLCPECARAWKQSEKTRGELPPTPASALPPTPAAPAPKPAPAKPAAPKPAAAAPKPAAKPAGLPKESPREHSGEVSFSAGTDALTRKPAPAAPAPKQPEPPREDSGTIEFVPEPKKPEDKK